MQAHGVTGLVIDAGVGDVAGLTTMGFPAWAAAVSAQGAVKATIGNVQTPIVCAGAQVDPGGLIRNDDDGVVAVARSRAAEVLRCARERERAEAARRGRYEAGELSLDQRGMRDRLATAGLVSEDDETGTA